MPTYIQSMTVAPTGDVYVGFNSVQHPTESNLSVSRDRGLTWTSLPHPGNDDYASLIAVADTTPPTIYVGNGSSTIDRSFDGGMTWDHIGPAIGANLSAIKIDPAAPARVYAAFAGQEVIGVQGSFNVQAALYVSEDSGSSWEELSPDIFEIGTTALEIDPRDSNVLVASTMVGLYISADRGLSWKPLSALGCSGWDSFAYEFLSQVLAVGPDGSIFAYNAAALEQSGCDETEVSHDNGRTWSLVQRPRSCPFVVVTLDPTDPAIILGGCGVETAISHDGGSSWLDFSQGHLFDLLAFSPDGQTVYGVYISQFFSYSFEPLTVVKPPSAVKVQR